MTDNEINGVIAEACGYVRAINGYMEACWCKDREFHTVVPDYANDLNAMHEAEKKFNPPSGDDWGTYIGLLDGLVKSRIHAPATQRAEAFLRTIGKWKE